jgi:hypothetical protein
MAKEKDIELAPDPMWADRVAPDQQPEATEEEQGEQVPTEQGTPES